MDERGDHGVEEGFAQRFVTEEWFTDGGDAVARDDLFECDVFGERVCDDFALLDEF